MPETTLLVEVDGAPLDAAVVAELADVQVEEAVDDADAATIVARLEPRDDGEWAAVLDALTSPRAPVVVEIARGASAYRFDGRAAQASWRIDADRGSELTVKAVDRVLDLDAEEKVVAWPGTSESGIAEAIFSEHGLLAQVEPTPDAPDPDVHVLLQRCTDWAFLRQLAARWGYAVYLESEGGRTTGHFHPVDPLAEPQAELSLGFGGGAGAVDVEADLVAGRHVKASRLPVLSDAPRSGESRGDDEPQGAVSLGGQTTVLLAPSDVAGEVEPADATEGLARRSAFALRLVTEVDAGALDLVLRARRPLLVRGLGSLLSGRWLVERVRHRVTPERHTQRLTLVRNALELAGDEPFGAGALGGPS